MEYSIDFLESEESYLQLLNAAQRLETFKNWPNDPDWHCTPEKLAEAGFYFNPSAEAPDNACCVFCKKELDGWEPDDDPVKEHKKHSPKCPFLALRKPFQDLTIAEVTKFICKVTIMQSERIFNQRMKDFAAASEEARQILLDQLKGKVAGED